MSSHLRLLILLAMTPLFATCAFESPPLDPAQFQKYPKGRHALTHVFLVDGTGTGFASDQTLLIDHDRIVAVGPSNQIPVPTDWTVIELAGHTVVPGLVGMHDHLFYAADGGARFVPMARSFAHLYLAAGVTTIRTGGAIDVESDLAVARDVEAGVDLGPKIHLTSPYFEARGNLPHLVAEVNRFADLGVTTIKAYTSIGRDELAGVIDAAHKRNLKVTGHLCAVGFRDAASLGIDNLEHGLIVDSEFLPGKVADQCPDWSRTVGHLASIDIDGPAIRDLIRELVERRVAVTSTLAVFDSLGTRNSFFDGRAQSVLNGSAGNRYIDEAMARAVPQADRAVWDVVLGKEMAFERAFVRAGGLLLSGADPTGWGGVVAGFGDARNIELLVEAGFTMPEAVQIATANGAAFLGVADRIGTVSPGKQADLVVLEGDLSTSIRHIRNVAVVFRGGVGFDPDAILSAERGRVGPRPYLLPWVIGAVTLLIVLLAIALKPRRRAKGGSARYG